LTSPTAPSPKANAMASEPLLDLNQYDLTTDQIEAAGIEAINPQRGDMRHLDGICYAELHAEKGLIAIGYKNVRADEFWVPGHIPDRPLLPGVIMIEAAAQLASFMVKNFRKEEGFLGFVGCENVKFRGQVVPGDRLVIVGHETSYRKGRRFACDTQGFVEGKLVFEGTIKGMAF
jgi:3-hydroxyacyl-[acyl-carrier-protein] dehydratase